MQGGIDIPLGTEVSSSSVAVNVFFMPSGMEEVVAMPNTSRKGLPKEVRLRYSLPGSTNLQWAPTFASYTLFEYAHNIKTFGIN